MPVPSLLAQPFVWLYLKTADDDYQSTVRFPLTGSDFFVSFQDDNVFSLGVDVPGTGTSKTGRAMARLNLIDPSFTYLEGLMVRNRFLSFEYGWMNENGDILDTSGQVFCMVSSIKPRFTYGGTELEVLLVSDMSVATAGNSVASMLSSTTISSKLFVAKDSKSAKTHGAGVDISSIRAEIQSNVLAGQQAEIEAGKKSYGNNPSILSEGGISALFNSVEARIQETGESVNRGVRYRLISTASSVLRYSRISDIVTYIAELCGMEHDIHETAVSDHDIYLVNKTLYSFLRDDLVKLAKDEKGVADYRFWVRGNTLYFKSAQKAKALKRFDFIGDQKSITERFSDNEKKSILLDFSLEVVPNLIINSPAVSSKAIGFDPIGKRFKGKHAAVQKLGDELYGEIFDETFKLYNKRRAAGRNIQHDLDNNTDLKSGDISASGYTATQENWLVWENAAQLAEEYYKNLADPRDASAESIEYRNANLKKAFQISAYRVLKKRKEDGLDVGLYDPAAASQAIAKSDADSIATLRKVPRDPTRAGRMYVVPYADSRAADMAEGILSASHMGPFVAKAVALGDATLRLMDKVFVIVHIPGGYHYCSGRYLVSGVVNKIDGNGFTTEISLNTDGVSNHSTVEELLRESEGGASPEEIKQQEITKVDQQRVERSIDKVINDTLRIGRK